jgi:hypothetical protein
VYWRTKRKVGDLIGRLNAPRPAAGAVAAA